MFEWTFRANPVLRRSNNTWSTWERDDSLDSSVLDRSRNYARYAWNPNNTQRALWRENG